MCLATIAGALFHVILGSLIIMIIASPIYTLCVLLPRFGVGHEQEGCEGIAHLASAHGDGCPTLSVVPAMQIVSIDNVEYTSSAESCLANVFFCGEG